jgi:integrase
MLLALALATGARRGELCALRWIDVNGDLIRIRRSLWRAGADRGEKGTKAGSWVSVGPVAAQLLVDWREKCEAAANKSGTELVADPLCVPSMVKGSRPVNPDTLSAMVTKLCAELGMPHMHLHSLRHYAAAELIGAGVNPRVAAQILGRAEPALRLRVYTHGTRARQLDAAGVLELALIPAESSGT